LKDYVRKVHYHETDKMGIVHHSNFIKWMEEARIDFLDRLGYSYSRLEKDGIISPVIAVECQYKSPAAFDDEIIINVKIEEFRGARLTVGYLMTNAESGAVVLTGRTKHCFVDSSGRPIALKKQFPEFDKVLKECIDDKDVNDRKAAEQ